MSMNLQDNIENSDLEAALKSAENDVRSNPADVNHRMVLFEIMCLLGRWDRATTQLKVISDMDKEKLLFLHMYMPAINSERLRTEIFQGQKTPLVFGEPSQWLGWMIQALQFYAQEDYDRAEQLRIKAFEQAPACSGTIGSDRFSWVCDSDTRIGPVIEAIVDGKYYWIPVSAVKEVKIEKPKSLIDLVWVTAYFTWTNEGKKAAMIPVRYPGTEEQDDQLMKMSRKTDWVSPAEGTFFGLGQRVFTTDQEDYPLLEIGKITFDHE